MRWRRVGVGITAAGTLIGSGFVAHDEATAKIDTVEEKAAILRDKGALEARRAVNTEKVRDGLHTKEYDAHTRKVHIKTLLGDTVLEARLLTSYKRMVRPGKDIRVAEIQLIDWHEGDTFFDALEAFDKHGDYAIRGSHQFTFKYAAATTTIRVSIAIPDENGFTRSVWIDEEVPDWDKAVPFVSLSELPHKNIPIGIYTDTTFGEAIEWLPTVRGIELYEWAAYDVTEIDSLQHTTGATHRSSIAQLDATHYIVAYSDPSANGYVKTFSIDASADNITEIDSLQIWTAGDDEPPAVVKIDATHFMVAYRGPGSDGFLATYSVDGSYDNITQIDVVEHDTSLGAQNSLVQIDATHYFLAYTSNFSRCSVKTFSIDGSADNITQLHALVHDTTNTCQISSAVKIDATHFMIAHTGTGGDGFIVTFSINGSYVISEIHAFEHDTADGLFHSLVQIDATHYAVAYTGVDGDGFIKTLLLNGSFQTSQIDVLEHDTSDSSWNSLVLIDSTHLLLAYTGVDGDGFVKTFSIDSSADNITEIDVFEHDTSNAISNSLAQVDATSYILAYTGASANGLVKTFAIEQDAPPAAAASEDGVVWFE